MVSEWISQLILYQLSSCSAVKRPSDGQVKKLEAENEDLQEQLQRMQVMHSNGNIGKFD